jgi:hypothetical protein
MAVDLEPIPRGDFADGRSGNRGLEGKVGHDRNQ